MMFNYDAESNAIAILRSMYKEMVPLQNVDDVKKMNFWESELVYFRLFRNDIYLITI